jgi:hypothetical protein
MLKHPLPRVGATRGNPGFFVQRFGARRHHENASDLKMGLVFYT